MHSYHFSNLLGATYQGGSIQFTPDGNTLLSPVGNRVCVTDLVQGRCSTLGPQNREDISVLALSPDLSLLLSIDTSGHALLTNFVRNCVLCRKNFKAAVLSARWSPDGAFLAVTHGRRIDFWRTPTLRLGWQFVQHRTFGGHYDDVVDLAWAPNSLFIASCSKDMSVRLYSLNPMDGFEPISLVEHRSHVRGVFFSSDMHHLYSLSRDGVLVALRFDLKEDQAADDAKKPLYCRPGEWVMLAKAYCQQPIHMKVTRCAFDAATNLFAAGFSEGIFMLYQMPDMQALQTLSLGNKPLDAVALGANGDWLAVGSGAVGQLLVWEWRSETYVLKQQGHHWGVQCVAFSPSAAPSLQRQKTLSTAEGRPEDRGSSILAGRLLATGGYDGKVKLFNAQSGLCFVTFAEHTAPVTAVCFTPQGNAVVSASQDGSVRAFDLLRYRNFRTFASPDGLCQFLSLGIDGGGEIVAASASGGKYAIYVWSIQTGSILEVLTGHTSPVKSLQFSPSTSHPGQLISGSWDGNIRVWDLYASGDKGGGAEALVCASSITCVRFDPRENDICAASCLSGQVLFWNVDMGTQVGAIEGLRDIRSGRQWHDSFVASSMKGTAAGHGLKKGSASSINLNQHYNSMAYVRSGELLLCGSRNSPHVVLYNTNSYTLVSRMTLTSNKSLSGVETILNSKNMTEMGVSVKELDLSDSEADDADYKKRLKRIRQATSLPGVSIGEAKDAYADRELHVWDIAFSADSLNFAAATTHGVFVYSADMGLGTPGFARGMGGSEPNQFAPQMLTRNVSAPAILKALESRDMSRAMVLALALNDHELLRRVYEAVPVHMIPVVTASIGSPLLPALLRFLSFELKPISGTPHFQFHTHWVETILDLHFATLLDMSAGRATARTGSALEAAAAGQSDVASLCLQLLVELSQQHSAIVKTFDQNIYLLRYLRNSPDDGATPERPPLSDVGKAVEAKVAVKKPNIKTSDTNGDTAETDQVAKENVPAKKKRRRNNAKGVSA